MEERSVEGESQRVRFLVDHMLGTLARNLRMFGFDAGYAYPIAPEALIQRAIREGRWLLTKRDLTKMDHRPITVLRIQDDHPHRQVMQVLKALPSHPNTSVWFTRCLRCNLPLDELPAREAKQRVPEYIALTHSRFRHCPSCGRIFWQGTHAVHMRKLMQEWVEEAQRGGARGSDEELSSA